LKGDNIMGDDIEKRLRDLGRQTPDYPKELWTARRAEYTTMVRTNKPKGPGCPLMGGALIVILTVVIYLTGLVV
jgi:hypothetical protein